MAFFCDACVFFYQHKPRGGIRSCVDVGTAVLLSMRVLLLLPPSPLLLLPLLARDSLLQ
jgi:hypothetical protein